MIRKKILWMMLIFLCQSTIAFASVTPLPDVSLEEGKTQIVINLPQQKLFLYKNGELDQIFPIGIGRNRTQTPIGEYKIGVKAYNPTWTIPASIRKERAAKGLPDIKTIEPGPNNPLGPLFIRFGEPELGLGIHGTNAPKSVPGIVSHGCIRMQSKDVLAFAEKIKQDDSVSVIYQTYALNTDENGQLWFARFSNPYDLKNVDQEKILATIQKWEELNQKPIDSKVVARLFKKGTSSLICLSCQGKKPKVVGKLTALAWKDIQVEKRAIIPKPRELDEIVRESLEPIDRIELKKEEIFLKNIKEYKGLDKLIRPVRKSF